MTGAVRFAVDRSILPASYPPFGGNMLENNQEKNGPAIALRGAAGHRLRERVGDTPQKPPPLTDIFTPRATPGRWPAAELSAQGNLMKHIFILAMDELQLKELGTLRDADQYQFHNVLDAHALVEAAQIDFDRLLEQARTQIRNAGGSVDAIIAHWDFPPSVLAPILSAEFGVPSPSLESVLKCEHKYWGRLEQIQAVPEVVPRFCAFDPFAAAPLDQIDLEFPFWIKPVKSFASQLGFYIRDAAEFHRAVAIIREKIGRIGHAFDQVLARVELPPALAGLGGSACLAEAIIEGEQLAPEGSVCRGRMTLHGLFDMTRNEAGTKIDGLIYPSAAPARVQAKITETCEKLLRHLGFDNGCFNVEFLWDAQRDQLWLIEVNPRISQSHSELFIQVDGMSNHEIAVQVALGKPRGLPRGEGPYGVAAKFILSQPEDGRVTRVPLPRVIDDLCRRFPLLQVRSGLKPGMRLSERPNQDPYNLVLGELYLGARDRDELMARYQTCVSALTFEIDPIPDLATPGTAPEPSGPSVAGANDEAYRNLSLPDKDPGERLYPDA